MKKCRFLWSAHRITERQKAGKSRSIKGKQLKNSRSTVSKQLVEHLSSPNDNISPNDIIRFGIFQKIQSRKLLFPGFFTSHKPHKRFAAFDAAVNGSIFINFPRSRYLENGITVDFLKMFVGADVQRPVQRLNLSKCLSEPMFRSQNNG